MFFGNEISLPVYIFFYLSAFGFGMCPMLFCILLFVFINKLMSHDW